MTIKNNIEQEPFIWVDVEISDFRQFKKSVQSWKDMDFIQLDEGTFHSVIKQMIFPEVHLAYSSYNCHLDQQGYSPNDMWSFVIMSEDASMYRFNHEVTQNTSTMVIFPPGAEIISVVHPGFSVYVFSMKEEHLQKLTHELGLEKIEEKLSQIDRVQLTPVQAASLRNQFKDILDNVTSMKHKVITPEGKNLLLQFIPIKLLKEIGTQIGCAKDKVIQEKHMFYMEAKAYMHTHLHETLSIEELAKKFKISERTLRNYFSEELNTSPKQYLIALRLTKIRGELQVLNMEKGVVEKTARRFGFQHMGQFSKAYKDFFGELPSETLRQV